MHVATMKKRHVTKAGQERVYESHLLRRTYREDGKVKHETLANLSALPDEQLERAAPLAEGRDVRARRHAAGHGRCGRCRTGTWPR